MRKTYNNTIGKFNERTDFAFGEPHVPVHPDDIPSETLELIAEAETYRKFCNEIAVFHEGSVIQQGAHDGLLADATGKYHELWHTRAQYYTEKTA